MTTTTMPVPSRRTATALEDRLALAAGAYAGLGLLAGLFYRTLTHSRNSPGPPPCRWATPGSWAWTTGPRRWPRPGSPGSSG